MKDHFDNKPHNIKDRKKSRISEGIFSQQNSTFVAERLYFFVENWKNAKKYGWILWNKGPGEMRKLSQEKKGFPRKFWGFSRKNFLELMIYNFEFFSNFKPIHKKNYHEAISLKASNRNKNSVRIEGSDINCECSYNKEWEIPCSHNFAVINASPERLAELLGPNYFAREILFMIS